MSKKISYYSLNKILENKATYNIIFGERSNGKTYSVLKYAVERFIKDRTQVAIVRRWKEDITGRRASGIFSALIESGEIEKLSNGEYTGVYYYSGKFYLCTYNESGKAIYNDCDQLGHAFALSESEHNKSISYPKVTTILFDEFITNKMYIQDEFVSFMNTVSTIVRQRTDVTIFMLGNTINRYCPYFKEMGLNNISNMKQGTIDVYTYGDSKLKVAVEYCNSINKQKKNNYFFAFNNPKLHMITSGSWELDLYPHLPIKYKPKDILFTYFIVFSGAVYQCEIIQLNDGEMLTFIHEKTTPIQDTENDLIYSLEYNYRMNYNRSILQPTNKLQKRILWFFQTSRVFYQDNTVGDAINNYLKTCSQI